MSEPSEQDMEQALALVSVLPHSLQRDVVMDRIARALVVERERSAQIMAALREENARQAKELARRDARASEIKFVCVFAVLYAIVGVALASIRFWWMTR